MPVDAREFLKRLFSGRKVRKDAQIEEHQTPEASEGSGLVEQLIAGVWLDIKIHGKDAGMSYDEDNKQLLIRYPGGDVYVYDDISQSEATSMLYADHKGTWGWDNLRIRGTVKGHQKPYALVSSSKHVRVHKKSGQEPDVHEFPGWTPI